MDEGRPCGIGEIWGENQRGRLIELLKRDALRLGSFTLASGRSSHYYVDGRKVTLAAEGASLIGLGMLAVLESYPEVDALGGLTLGADPIVGATLALAASRGRASLRGFLVRKAAKAHGTGNLVEGPLEPGSTVAIVDDVATTGGSSFQAVEAVEALGCKVAVVAVVLDRLEGAAAAFEARGLSFRPLLSIRDLGVDPLSVG
ncbi:MAG TPA: orotate phosphoribosyltransferase [Isosphaeraceae bacterium]|nr:orotate phosphoribosyltransferase [Isosphaeraceae bacterium]